MTEHIDQTRLDQALWLLAAKLELRKVPRVGLVVCGGSALIQLGLRSRTTKDLDVVALLNADHELTSPDPLPAALLEAAEQVGRDMSLFEDWLNNGPSRGEGGLFQLGLPEGLAARLTEKHYSNSLSVHFVSRMDQIHFKLYATCDQPNGRHLSDLIALSPTAPELDMAARWAMTHDVSEGFRTILKELLIQIGHEPIAERI